MKKPVVDDVMSVTEASNWLKIPRSTLYKLCMDGEVPSAKVGRHWRFYRATLEKWLQDKTRKNVCRKNVLTKR